MGSLGGCGSCMNDITKATRAKHDGVLSTSCQQRNKTQAHTQDVSAEGCTTRTGDNGTGGGEVHS
jgi:hypothetical protein